ncbi:MAG TPA: regulatory protein RecX [Acidobacteriota bacterium]|nr:regulatory protein RecX [Acidobacteriota bacterium]
MEEKPETTIMKKAGKLLARRAFSRGELRHELAKTSGKDLEPVLDRLERQNLLNDADYAYNFAVYRIGREGWSPARASAALCRRLVAPSIIDAALERVRKELGTAPPLLQYIRKRCGEKGPPSNPEALNKLVSHLRRRGFDEETIFIALKEILPASVFLRIEQGE